MQSDQSRQEQAETNDEQIPKQTYLRLVVVLNHLSLAKQLLCIIQIDPSKDVALLLHGQRIQIWHHRIEQFNLDVSERFDEVFDFVLAAGRLHERRHRDDQQAQEKGARHYPLVCHLDHQVCVCVSVSSYPIQSNPIARRRRQVRESFCLENLADFFAQAMI